ncbi:hypothetical protein ACFU67_00020 [Streptomyces rhizosphaericola]|uniref:hypothetical protein n=1 Tax=Streptomyces rhizosphaericola TaxID=2564098 RepID=UPI0036AB7D3E
MPVLVLVPTPVSVPVLVLVPTPVPVLVLVLVPKALVPVPVPVLVPEALVPVRVPVPEGRPSPSWCSRRTPTTWCSPVSVRCGLAVRW